MCRRKLHDGAEVLYETYGEGQWPINGQTKVIKKKDKQDLRRYRSVTGPRLTGNTRSSKIFWLQQSKNKSVRSFVLDQLGTLTTYDFNRGGALLGLSYKNVKGEALKREIFEDSYGFRKHKVCFPDNQVCSTHLRIYDKKGNKISDEYKGTGISRKTEYKWSEGFVPQLLEIRLPSGQHERFTYLNDTNLPLTHTILVNNQVIKKTTFTYDRDHILVRKVEESGKQKLIQVIRPCQIMPGLGHPEEIEERYYDFDKCAEQLLSRVRYTYTKLNKKSKEEFFDANNKHVYTINRGFDKHGQILWETDLFGSKTRHSYDGRGNLSSSINDSTGIKIVRIYDDGNRLVELRTIGQNGSVKTEKFTYDSNGRLCSQTDEHGSTTRYEYDAIGRKIATILPTGHVIKSSYDIFDRKVLDLYPDGREVKYIRFIDGKIARFVYGRGICEQRIFNDDDTLKSIEDPDKVRQDFVYDAQKRLVDNSDEKFTYDGTNLASYTDSHGITTYYRYDGACRKISELRNGNETKYSYDALGRVVYEDTIGVRKSIEYDLLGRPTVEKIEDTDGNLLSLSSTTYDAAGNITESKIHTLEGTNTETFSYDDLYRLVSFKDSEGNITKYSYDKLKTTTVHPNGLVVIEMRNPNGHMISVESYGRGQLLQKEEFKVDYQGNRLFQKSLVIDPDGQRSVTVTRWEYDTLGRLARLTEDASGKTPKCTSYTYSKAGRLLSQTNPDGRSIHFTYDSKGRLSSLKASDNSFYYQYAYENNRVISITNLIDKAVTTYVYNHKGELLREVQANGVVLEYFYDQLGRRTCIILPDKTGIKYCYGHYYLRRVERIDANRNVLYAHTYDLIDSSGKLLTESLPFNMGLVSYKIDSSLRTVSVKSPYITQEILSFDPSGNPTSMSGGREYDYDLLGRLTKETSQQYCYDSHGNIHDIELFGKPNALCQPQRVLNELLTFDKNGNRTSKGSDRRYSYDPLGRLIEVTSKEFTLKFTYDATHRRMSKTLIKNGQVHFIEKYLYDGEKEIGLIDQTGEIKQLRVLGVGKGAEISASISIELADKVYVPLHDLFGNVTHLLDPYANVVETYQYSAYGKLEKPPVSNNPWLFQSKRFDRETHLYFFGQRYYDPETAIFLTPDPAGIGDIPNLYQFANSNPLKYCDLYGLEAVAIDAPKEPKFHLRSMPSYTFTLPITMGASLGYGPFSTSMNFHSQEQEELFAQFNQQHPTLQISPFRYETALYNIFEVNKDSFKPVRPLIYTNGICNKHADIIETASWLGGKTNNSIFVNYNPSNNILSDIVRANGSKVSKTANEAALALAKSIENLNTLDTYKITLFAHSEGTINARNAVRLLTGPTKEKLTVHLFAPVTFIHDPTVRNIKLYISSGDCISMACCPIIACKMLGGLAKHGNVREIYGRKVELLHPEPGAKMNDHSILGATYSKKLEDILDRHNQKVSK